MVPGSVLGTHGRESVWAAIDDDDDDEMSVEEESEADEWTGKCRSAMNTRPYCLERQNSAYLVTMVAKGL